MTVRDQLSEAYKNAYASVRDSYPAVPVNAEVTIKDFAERLSKKLGFGRYELAIVDANPPNRRISIDGNYRAYVTLDGELAFTIKWTFVPDEKHSGRNITLDLNFTLRGKCVQVEFDGMFKWVDHTDPSKFDFCAAQVSQTLLRLAQNYGAEHACSDLKMDEVTGRSDTSP